MVEVNGTANGRVNHTQAQADTHIQSGKLKGGHAELMVVVGVQGGLNFCWSRLKQDKPGTRTNLP